MSTATDERIRDILRIWTQNQQADREKKRAQEQTEQQQQLVARIREKWRSDTHLIAAILKDFEQKLAELQVQLVFQDRASAHGETIAVGSIAGHVTGNDLQLTLNVHPNGHMLVFKEGAKIDHMQIPLLSPKTVSVLTADRDQYENLILDYIEGSARIAAIP